MSWIIFFDMQSSFTWKNDYETRFPNLFLPSATVAKSYFSLQVIAGLPQGQVKNEASHFYFFCGKIFPFQK